MSLLVCYRAEWLRFCCFAVVFLNVVYVDMILSIACLCGYYADSGFLAMMYGVFLYCRDLVRVL